MRVATDRSTPFEDSGRATHRDFRLTDVHGEVKRALIA
jgi:hypothetical protein